ncbi:MAG: transglutaminase [Rhizobiaceae bacterium]|nr:MAG: transglutaminase [Rhizobiaceae bacterium]
MLGLLAVAWNVTDAVASASMVTGGLTSQPIGHYDFCKLHPGECNIHPGDLQPLKVSKAVWHEIVKVNDAVNRNVKPMSDYDHYGKDEVWAYPDDGFGDCEDYVLEKRRELMREGISLSDLLITVVKKKDGEGHAVLTVRTSRGDYILDNLTNEVKPWTSTPYRYLKRQATDDTGRWVTIREGQTTLVGAVD